MKKPLVICLCCLLALPVKATAYSAYYDDNPFVEAMLRMMEVFGLIDRDRLPLSVPYLPGYSQYLTPGLGTLGTYPLTGLGGVPGMSPLTGLGGVPGVSPLTGLGGIPGLSPLGGLGGVTGLSPLSGMGGVPGMTGIPGAGGWPYGTFPGTGHWSGSGYRGLGTPYRTLSLLDGVWELENGTFVIIQGENARLFLSREQYQDFAIRYDRQYLWWKPLRGGAASRYLYQTRQGRMILRDDEGQLLLMRRRR